MTFKMLDIGEVFVFASAYVPGWIGAGGPWKKISPRKYSHLHREDLGNIQVGSIHVHVSTNPQLVYR